jgi:serine/threonine protein kinase
MIGFELGELIGRGGMGARLPHDGRQASAPGGAHADRARAGRGPAFPQALPRGVAASLDHASVVAIYEAGEQDGQLFLAMRYVEGSDLRTLLRRDGSFTLERTLALLGQIASALDAAHRSGLVHRHVKPANILVDEDERSS